MRIMVTGSAGRLGAEVCKQLKADGHEVSGLDTAPSDATSFLGSVENRKLVHQAAAGCDAIIHTASLHAPHVQRRSRSDFVAVNVQGTLNVVESAIANQVSSFVYTSTTSLYGRAMQAENTAVWVDEQLHPEPRDVYDITKIAAEQLCVDSMKDGLPPPWVLRVSRFFLEEPIHLRAIYRLYRGIDFRDAARAHCLAAVQPTNEPQVLNISGSSPFTRDDLVELCRCPTRVIERVSPSTLRHFGELDWKLPTSIDRVYATGKAKELLGFVSKRGIDAVFEEALRARRGGSQ